MSASASSSAIRTRGHARPAVLADVPPVHGAGAAPQRAGASAQPAPRAPRLRLLERLSQGAKTQDGTESLAATRRTQRRKTEHQRRLLSASLRRGEMSLSYSLR